VLLLLLQLCSWCTWLLRLGRGAKYCVLSVCLFVCLSSRIYQKPHVQISPNSLYFDLPVAVTLAAFHTARKSEFPSSFFRVPSSEVGLLLSGPSSNWEFTSSSDLFTRLNSKIPTSEQSGTRPLFSSDDSYVPPVLLMTSCFPIMEPVGIIFTRLFRPGDVGSARLPVGRPASKHAITYRCTHQCPARPAPAMLLSSVRRRDISTRRNLSLRSNSVV